MKYGKDRGVIDNFFIYRMEKLVPLLQYAYLEFIKSYTARDFGTLKLLTEDRFFKKLQSENF